MSIRNKIFRTVTAVVLSVVMVAAVSFAVVQNKPKTMGEAPKVDWGTHLSRDQLLGEVNTQLDAEVETDGFVVSYAYDSSAAAVSGAGTVKGGEPLEIVVKPEAGYYVSKVTAKVGGESVALDGENGVYSLAAEKITSNVIVTPTLVSEAEGEYKVNYYYGEGMPEPVKTSAYTAAELEESALAPLADTELYNFVGWTDGEKPVTELSAEAKEIDLYAAWALGPEAEEKIKNSFSVEVSWTGIEQADLDKIAEGKSAADYTRVNAKVAVAPELLAELEALGGEISALGFVYTNTQETSADGVNFELPANTPWDVDGETVTWNDARKEQKLNDNAYSYNYRWENVSGSLTQGIAIKIENLDKRFYKPWIMIKQSDEDEASVSVKAEYTAVPAVDFDGGKTVIFAGSDNIALERAEGGSIAIQSNADGTDGRIIAAIAVGDKFTYNVYSTVEKEVEIILSAAGVTGADAFSCQVNDDESHTVAVNTGSWTNWADTFACYAKLKKGLNTIAFTSVNVNGNANVNGLTVYEKSAYIGEEHKYGAGSGSAVNCGTNFGGGYDGSFFDGVQPGSEITFTVNSSVKEKVDLRVYAAGGNNNGEWGWTEKLENAFKVTVNDGAELGAFGVGPTGWTDFQEIYIGTAELNAGTNTIKIQSVDASGNLNVSYLVITPNNGEDPSVMGTYSGEALKLEAEKAEISDCRVESGQGSSENGFVGGIGDNATITFKFKSTVAGNATISLSAAGRHDDGSPYTDAFEVYVNDSEEPLKLTVGTSGWTDFTPLYVGLVTLKANEINTIRFVAKGTNSQVNVDYLLIAPVYDGTTELQVGAQEFSIEGSGNHQSGFSTYDGTLVGNFGGGSSVKVKLIVSGEVSVDLSILADGDNNQNHNFEVIVNGQTVGTFSYASQGWTNFLTVSAGTATLHEGENTIEIKSVSGGFNFGGLKITPHAE